jgi:hypothetical protein
VDANKAKKLRELEYVIKGTCATCVHGVFRGDAWGTCLAWQYDHLKHSEATRQLSIHMSGRCEVGYEPDPTKLKDLGGFGEFFKG